VYSLGSTLYQLLEGRPAFQRDVDTGIAPLLLRVLTEQPPPFTRTDMPEVLTAVVLKAMDRRPEERFASAGAMAAALQQAQAALGLPVTEIPEHAVEPPPYHAAGGDTISPWAPQTPRTPSDSPTPPPPTAAAPPSPQPGPPTAASAPAPPATPPVGTTAPDPQSTDAPLSATPWSGSETMTGWKPPAPPGSAAASAVEESRPAPAAPDAFARLSAEEPLVGLSRQSTRPDKRRRGPVALLSISAAILVAALVSALIVTFTGSPSHPGPHAQSTPTPSTAPATTAVSTSAATGAAPQASAANAAPIGLTARSLGSSVTLTWTLPPDDNFPLVLVQSPATSPAPTYLDIGTTTYSVGGLNAAEVYCFKVGAVVSVGAAAGFQWAAPVCAKG
jgi:hypothetical protein